MFLPQSILGKYFKTNRETFTLLWCKWYFVEIRYRKLSFIFSLDMLDLRRKKNKKPFSGLRWNYVTRYRDDGQCVTYLTLSHYLPDTILSFKFVVVHVSADHVDRFLSLVVTGWDSYWRPNGEGMCWISTWALAKERCKQIEK